MTIVTEQVSTIDPTHARDVMSKVPTSVTVVAGQPELPEERAAMIVGSFVFVSLKPCLVGFFVGRESTSWPQINKSTVLGISTLASGQADFCRKLGKKEEYRFPTLTGAAANTVHPLWRVRWRPLNARSRTSRQSATTTSSWPRGLGLGPGTTANPLVFQNHTFSGLNTH